MTLAVPRIMKIEIQGFYHKDLLACLEVPVIDDFLSRAPDDSHTLKGILRGLREDISMIAFCLTRFSGPGHYIAFLNDDDPRPDEVVPYGARDRLDAFMKNRTARIAAAPSYANVAV